MQTALKMTMTSMSKARMLLCLDPRQRLEQVRMKRHTS